MLSHCRLVAFLSLASSNHSLSLSLNGKRFQSSEVDLALSFSDLHLHRLLPYHGMNPTRDMAMCF